MSKDQPHKQPSNCPNCLSSQPQLIFYACCLKVVCEGCFDGFHFLECKKKFHRISQTIPVSTNRFSTAATLRACDRCEATLTEEAESCASCFGSFCKPCSQLLHQTGKFSQHARKKLKKEIESCEMSSGSMNPLNCCMHNKERTIITENLQLLCLSCFTQNRETLNKLKDNLSETTLQSIEQQITSLELKASHLVATQDSYWQGLSKQLSKEYDRMKEQLETRYRDNLRSMEKWSMEFKVPLLELKRMCANARTEIQRIDQTLGTKLTNFTLTRANLLSEEILIQNRKIKEFKKYHFRLIFPTDESMELLLKSFAIQKIKESNERGNSHTKSISKLDNSRVSRLSKGKIPRDVSTVHNSASKKLRSNSKERVFSHQGSDGKPPMGGSDRKIHHNKNASGQSLTYKLQTQKSDCLSKDILSTKTLIHDKLLQKNKDSLQYKPICSELFTLSVNLSQQTVLTENSSNFNSVAGECSKPKIVWSTLADKAAQVKASNKPIVNPPKQTKKPDYMDLRERMRKPNITNRFAKKDSHF